MNRAFSVRRARQAAKHPNDRGLAGAIRAQKTKDFTFVDGQRYRIDRDRFSEASAQSIQRNNGVSHFSLGA